MLASLHHGTTSTLPIGSWCLTLIASDGRLTCAVAFRCPGCGLVKTLLDRVADDGSVPMECGPCGTRQTLKLDQWDPDPC